MPVVTTPITPLEAGGEMFQRAKTQSFIQVRSSTARPLSEVSDFIDTEFEDSDNEDYAGRGYCESFDSSRRRSQTTISSYDEVPTPRSNRSFPAPLDIRKSTEGPRGPHLFRASQVSPEMEFDYTMQMSPLFPKTIPPRTATAFSQQTVTPTAQTPGDFSIEAALTQPQLDEEDPEAYIRAWTTQQVIDWMYAVGIEDSIIECFERHDISGAVLLDLKWEYLVELDILSFGKRHQLWSAICNLRGVETPPSPQPTPFQDISRPCTTNPRRSPRSANGSPVYGDATPISPSGGKKRRGRKAPKALDVVTPGESVSIVAIEQLLPKPHKCTKGERCAKWRQQQRQLQRLQDENAIGRFPISPTKGGRIFVAGDPGNAATAANIIRPHSAAPSPSIVASSDLLGPEQLPAFALHPDSLNLVEMRDPQDNVRQFLTFQHMESPTKETQMELAAPDSIPRSASVPLFPREYHQAYPALHQSSHSPSHSLDDNLKSLPRLSIPRGTSCAPQPNTVTSPEAMTSACRSATASPLQTWRLGTPASEMDLPVTVPQAGPVARDASQSVPPNMQFRQQHTLSRSYSSRHGPMDWRRPSMTLPAVQEGEVLSPSSDDVQSRASGHGSISTTSSTSSLQKSRSVPEPSRDAPKVHEFGYGADCTHSGWMKKRKTKMLRNEWQEAHFRLKGAQLAMHENARLSSVAKETINVDEYAVACSSVPSTNKLTAAMKAFHIKNSSGDATKNGKDADPTAFAFQLVPSKEGDKKNAANGKTHHFAVTTKDDRIDWMRELMLAKALQQKGKGYDVEVNGVSF